MQHDNHARTRASRALRYVVFAVLLGLVVGGGASAAPRETVLYSFTGGSDGAEPQAGLIADSSGNLYGTTSAGVGTIFKLSAGETLTTLYSFCGLANCSDGVLPAVGLIADTNGNLYGTTFGYIYRGEGATVFKLSPDGTETVLHTFNGRDGWEPTAPLISDASGNLYGTTQVGCRLQKGTVFRLSPGGIYKVLHSFTGNTDGAYPVAGLIADQKGHLYGTATRGGAGGGGVIFRLSAGGGYKLLHSFNGTDGESPQASLIVDNSGNLYGTTTLGGASGYGTIFKLSPNGRLIVLHNFKVSNGAYPDAALIIDSQGNLFGTTVNGGASNDGVVFKLSPSGSFRVLHSFGGGDGALPQAGLYADSRGNLIGTTARGGSGCSLFSDGCGTVFKVMGTGFVPEAPPAR